jgi:hypothetical protein
MKVGDLVKRSVGQFGENSELCLIVDIITQTSASSAGCKKYTVVSASGGQKVCWISELEVVNESR